MELTSELIGEGLARETISKVQQLRKNNGFEVENRIKIYYNSDDSYESSIANYIDMIKDETLAVEVIRVSEQLDSIDINDYKVGFRLEKV